MGSCAGGRDDVHLHSASTARSLHEEESSHRSGELCADSRY